MFVLADDVQQSRIDEWLSADKNEEISANVLGFAHDAVKYLWRHVISALVAGGITTFTPEIAPHRR